MLHEYTHAVDDVCLACARVQCNGASAKRLYSLQLADPLVALCVLANKAPSLLRCLTSAFWLS